MRDSVHIRIYVESQSGGGGRGGGGEIIARPSL